VEVAARGKLMPRVRTDGFNENQIEAESAGKGKHRIGVALVVSRTIFSDSDRVRLSFDETHPVLCRNLEVPRRSDT